MVQKIGNRTITLFGSGFATVPFVFMSAMAFSLILDMLGLHELIPFVLLCIMALPGMVFGFSLSRAAADIENLDKDRFFVSGILAGSLSSLLLHLLFLMSSSMVLWGHTFDDLGMEWLTPSLSGAVSAAVLSANVMIAAGRITFNLWQAATIGAGALLGVFLPMLLESDIPMVFSLVYAIWFSVIGNLNLLAVEQALGTPDGSDS